MHIYYLQYVFYVLKSIYLQSLLKLVYIDIESVSSNRWACRF